MPVEAKYITVNGVLMKNPAYEAPGVQSVPVVKAVSRSNLPLAVVSSADDLIDASDIQIQATGRPVTQATSTEASMDKLQDPVFLAEFMSPVQLGSGEIVDKLGAEFSKYETPIGMINKLLGIRDRNLNFIIDDSGSMGRSSDVKLNEATPFVLKGRTPDAALMNRWEEAEDRLHIMIDLLAYIPTKPIKISFLNSTQEITLSRADLTPDQFKVEAHRLISEAFITSHPTDKCTPTYRALKKAFDNTAEPSIHYFFTDGVPSDRSPDEVAHLINTRSNPNQNALMLISCTNVDKDTEWMKLVDGTSSFVAEVDDFGDEKEEVLKKQGPGFPYTRGLWILCQLAGAINTHDLDAVDETLPFTKSTLDNILGRQLSPTEYQYYFERNPSASLYLKEYERFLTEPHLSNEMISKAEQARREQHAGFSREGYAPLNRPLPAAIARQLEAITLRHMPTTASHAPAATGLGSIAASMGFMSVNTQQQPQQQNSSVFKMGGLG